MTTPIDPSTSGTTSLGMFILDVLRHDEIESLQSIVSLLNDEGVIGWRRFWPHDFSYNEVLDEIMLLIRSKYVVAFREESGGTTLRVIQSPSEIIANADAIWFSLSEKGQEVWEAWDPPVLDGDT